MDRILSSIHSTAQINLGSVCVCVLVSVVPALGSWRQEDQKFKVILGYIVGLMSA